MSAIQIVKSVLSAVAGAAAVGLLTCGCQTRITAYKHAEQMLPVWDVKDGVAYVARYDRASGGWDACARSPLWADEELRGLVISVETNGAVRLELADYSRDLSTNAVVMTEKLVDGAVELTAKVTAAIVTSGGSTAASAATSAIQKLVAKFIAGGGDPDNAKIECRDGSCTITDGAYSCTDGSCYPVGG